MAGLYASSIFRIDAMSIPPEPHERSKTLLILIQKHPGNPLNQGISGVLNAYLVVIDVRLALSMIRWLHFQTKGKVSFESGCNV